MQMPAERRGKRHNDARIEGCSSSEQTTSKRQKFNGKSHICLEWDGEKVVPQQGQIGISQRVLMPFLGSVPQCRHRLADVVTIPHQIFELEDLSEVLTNEVWQTYLSEFERASLIKFLPRGVDVENSLRGLLAGDNFHFGNPFLKWGALVCSGKCHPDAALHQEQLLKACKEVYYKEIQNYHNGMIDHLRKLKETWARSKDIEIEAVQKLCRSGMDSENGTMLCSAEENIVTTSELSSSPSEDTLCVSDNQVSPVIVYEEHQPSACENGFLKVKSKKNIIYTDDATPRKGYKLKNRNIHYNNDAKCMSRPKTSKMQELVKTIKQSSKGIRSKSLNQVLGNSATQALTHEEFVKEECLKLKEHWLRLSTKDLPTAYANWRVRLAQRQKIYHLLEQDLMDKIKPAVEFQIKDECQDETLLLNDNNQVISQQFDMEDIKSEEEGNPSMRLEDMSNQEPGKQEFIKEGGEDSGSEYPSFSQNVLSVDRGGEIVEAVMDLKTDCIAVDAEYHAVASKSDNCVASQPSNYFSDVSEYSVLSAGDGSINQEIPVSSGGNVWSSGCMSSSYHETTADNEYTGSNGFLIPHQLHEDQRSHLMDVESDRHEEDNRNDLFHRQPPDTSFPTYQNPDQCGLLQSMFKTYGSHLSEQKQLAGLNFQPASILLNRDSHIPGNLQGHPHLLQPLAHEQRRNSHDLMHQNILGTTFSDGGTFLFSRQGHVPAVGVQDLAVNPVQMSSCLSSQLSDDTLFSQNLYTGEYQVSSSWNGSDFSSIPILSQSVQRFAGQIPNGDFSQYHSSGGDYEQFMMSRNYGVAGGAVVAPRMNTAFPQVANPLNYLSSGHKRSNSLRTDDTVWMNLAQNSSLRDPMREL